MMLNGRRVFIQPEVKPRMQCSDEFRRIQSPRLVAETDAWMIERFGWSWGLHHGQVLAWHGGIAMTQATYDRVLHAQRTRINTDPRAIRGNTFHTLIVDEYFNPGEKNA